MIIRRDIIMLITLSIANLCYGWGQKGHDVVAYIAEQHLTPTTAHAVDSLLGGKSLVYWANWLDNASHTPEYRYMSTWHYKNVDPGVNYADAPVHPNGNIITALNAQVDSLRTGLMPHDRARLALIVVNHLVGDLHQPMHLGRLKDMGGNDRTVIYFKRNTNLHTIWDTNLIEDVHRWSYTEWQQQLDRLSPEQQTRVVAGTFYDWGYESYLIACDIYDKTPKKESLGYNYQEQWREVIETQLLRGGLRLAHVLNSIFDPEY